MRGRALVLDCDGVLADTELHGHLVAFNAAFDRLGLPFRWSAEEYRRLLRVGGGKERLRAYLVEHPEVDLGPVDRLDQVVAEVHQTKSRYFADLVAAGALPARPGVARLVTAALADGWQVAVASTSALPSVTAVLRAVLGPVTTARLAGVFAGDVVPAKKPAPDIYRLALDRLSRSQEEVVVIEDSAAGALAAARAGLAHIVTVSRFTTDDDFPHATTVVNHLGDPGVPARLLSGRDVRGPDQMIDVTSLTAVLRHSPSPRPLSARSRCD